ncbi:hypothetical protein OAE12_01580 [bacterium]|nr:hypothetical protein [bacterium]
MSQGDNCILNFGNTPIECYNPGIAIKSTWNDGGISGDANGNVDNIGVN